MHLSAPYGSPPACPPALILQPPPTPSAPATLSYLLSLQTPQAVSRSLPSPLLLFPDFLQLIATPSGLFSTPQAPVSGIPPRNLSEAISQGATPHTSLQPWAPPSSFSSSHSGLCVLRDQRGTWHITFHKCSREA